MITFKLQKFGYTRDALIWNGLSSRPSKLQLYHFPLLLLPTNLLEEKDIKKKKEKKKLNIVLAL